MTKARPKPECPTVSALLDDIQQRSTQTREELGSAQAHLHAAFVRLDALDALVVDVARRLGLPVEGEE